MTTSPFLFERYAFDAPTGVLQLHYRYENGAAFEEQIVFPPSSRPLSATDLQALDAAFRLIFLLAGVSYYKAYVPEHLRCTAFVLDKATAAFIEKVYRHGLGEFSYKNKLDLSDRIHVAYDNTSSPDAVTLDLPHHLLIPVGGGKDSIVTLECLKQSGPPLTLFGLGGTAGLATPIQATITTSGLPSLAIVRTLSPNLIELNKTGAYNGHIPITAILSALAIASAILYGMDTVVLSNEHSASAPNLRFHDLEVNHQYSKSFAFEQDFAGYVKEHISPQLHYFSFLRPLTEAAITRRFAAHEKYFDIFRSCNTAFRQDHTLRNKKWCCDCPKCRFVFLALAPFLAPEKLTAIFGKNMLDDKTQQKGFAELCGLEAFKPFECVGEVEESALLMEKLFQSPAWKEFCIVSTLGAELAMRRKNFDHHYNALFDLKSGHALSETYLKMLHACA